jgi:hypothetical protein
MGATKASSQDRPIFDPSDAMFNSHTDGAHRRIEGALFLCQFAAFRFFVRDKNCQTCDGEFFSALSVQNFNPLHQFVYSLVAFIHLQFATVWQALDRLEFIAQGFIVFSAGNAFADGLNRMFVICQKLGFEGELLLLPE